MKRIYLAGPFFSATQLKEMRQLEQILSHNQSVKSFFSPRLGKVSAKVGTPQWSQQVFQLDTEEIKKADVVFAVIDYLSKYVDSGTAFEIGYANRMQKPVVLFHRQTGIVNLMLANAAHAYLTDYTQVKAYDFDRLPINHYSGKVM